MNLPTYRAKKIDCDEWVEGYYIEDYGIASYMQESKYLEFIVSDRGERGIVSDNLYEVDPTTIEIHFPDSINTNSGKVWYNIEEISNIVKEHENGKVETSYWV